MRNMNFQQTNVHLPKKKRIHSSHNFPTHSEVLEKSRKVLTFTRKNLKKPSPYD